MYLGCPKVLESPLNSRTVLTLRKGKAMKNFHSHLIRSISGAVLVALIFFLPVGPAASAEPPPDFLAAWGSGGSGEGQFSSPRGVAVDSAANVYVADSYNHRIQKFDAGGTFLAQWGSSGTGDGQFFGPWDVAVDSAGNVYVADTGNHRIQKFDAGGTFLAQWGSSGSDVGQFSSPRGVAVDGAGNVYVADSYNDRIQKFDAGGTFLARWGVYGEGEGQFSYPSGVAVDDAGNVYVADTSNHRVQKFGYPSLDVNVEVDIRPWSCRNPLNMRSRGVLPVAILGSADLDVRTIVVTTITLSLEGAEEGAAPIRSTYADVSRPLEGELCERSELGPDGYEDLILKFKTQEVAEAIRALGEVNHRDVVVLTISGTLEDGTHFAGEDSVKIIKRRCKKHWKWSKGKKGCK